MTSASSAWCARMDVLVWRVERGEDGLMDQLCAASDAGVALAAGLPPEDLALIRDRLARAVGAATKAKDDLAGRIDELPALSRAARRYVAAPLVRSRRTAGA